MCYIPWTDITQRLLYYLYDETLQEGVVSDVVCALGVVLENDATQDDWEKVARFLLCTLHSGKLSHFVFPFSRSIVSRVYRLRAGEE